MVPKQAKIADKRLFKEYINVCIMYTHVHTLYRDVYTMYTMYRHVHTSIFIVYSVHRQEYTCVYLITTDATRPWEST